MKLRLHTKSKMLVHAQQEAVPLILRGPPSPRFIILVLTRESLLLYMPPILEKNRGSLLRSDRWTTNSIKRNWNIFFATTKRSSKFAADTTHEQWNGSKSVHTFHKIWECCREISIQATLCIRSSNENHTRGEINPRTSGNQALTRTSLSRPQRTQLSDHELRI